MANEDSVDPALEIGKIKTAWAICKEGRGDLREFQHLLGGFRATY